MCDNGGYDGPCGGCYSCMEAQRAYYAGFGNAYTDNVPSTRLFNSISMSFYDDIPNEKVNWKQEGF